jgi:redox-sensing transcriptional repressor
MAISSNISRLLQYRQILINLNELGFETVFSYSLGKEAGVSAEQVRKDFSQFGIKGNKKGGYNINELLFTINGIFRKDELQKVILVGLGNIGNAMIQYKGFRKNMIQIVAAFDIDPAKYKRKYELPVYPLESLQEVVNDLGVRTAILAVPEREAQQVTTQLVQTGITGILNFTPAVLKVPQHVMVSNIRIGNALETLIYQSCFRDGGELKY